jgi:hypothetical protein
MLDTGRRALAGILAGGAWITWGLIISHAVAPPVALTPITLALILTASLLLIGSGYCILKARSLRKKHPFPRRPLNKGFLIVTLLEAAGVGAVIAAAQKLSRLDALPDWIGLVIGLHFFGIARVLRARVYYVTGTAITLWCLLLWIPFRGTPLPVFAGVGIGAILWATSSFNLLRMLASSAAG